MKCLPLLYCFLIFFHLNCKISARQSKNQPDGNPVSQTDTLEVNGYNWYLPPTKTWAFKNMNKIFKTASITKGSGMPTMLPDAATTLNHLQIPSYSGREWGFQTALDSTYTDALLVYQRGEIKLESYRNGMQRNSYHNWFSMSKSLTGIGVLILADAGAIDLNKSPLYYLPELKKTAWENTTIQMILDMQVSIDFDEDYNDPESDLYDFGRVAQFVKIPGKPSPFESVIEYLKTIQTKGEHNKRFQYNSLNTEVLGLLMQKVTGRPPSEFIGESIWSKIGAENDAYIVQDPDGHQLVSAAVNSTLRDLTRFGIMILNGGTTGKETVLANPHIQSLFKGGDASKFVDSKYANVLKGSTYQNQWWHLGNSEIAARGLFGQMLYINKEKDLVIAKFSTHAFPNSPKAAYFFNDIQLMKGIAMEF